MIPPGSPRTVYAMGVRHDANRAARKKMIVFHYDKSFDGLLSAVFDAYTGRLFPDALLGPEDVQLLLAGRAHSVITKEEKADRVFRGLKKRLSRQAGTDLLLAWLSEQPGSDLLLFRYMRKVFDSARPVERDYADSDVFAVRQLAEKVTAERCLLRGFARFQKTAEGLYFAVLSPKYNILPWCCRILPIGSAIRTGYSMTRRGSMARFATKELSGMSP